MTYYIDLQREVDMDINEKTAICDKGVPLIFWETDIDRPKRPTYDERKIPRLLLTDRRWYPHPNTRGARLKCIDWIESEPNLSFGDHEPLIQKKIKQTGMIPVYTVIFRPNIGEATLKLEGFRP